MSDLISLSEWFSSTNTSTLVTALERVGATPGVDVCVVVFAGVGWALDLGATGGVLLGVEQPDAPRARTQASAAPRTIRSIMGRCCNDIHASGLFFCHGASRPLP